MRSLRRLWRSLASSLRARILLPTAVLFAIVLTIMVVSAVQVYGADMERGLHDRAEFFAGMITSGLTNVMLQGTPEQLPEMLAMVARHRADLETVSVIRGDGEVRVSSEGSLVGTKPWGDLRQISGTSIFAAPGGNEGQYAVLHPIPNAEVCARCHGAESRVNGWLDLRFTRAPALQLRAQLGHTLAFSATVAFVILLAIAWWLQGRETIRPLHRLVGAMRQAESGDLAVRADNGRPDELGVAARGFDAMLAALRRSQAELESFYRERMVRADRFAAVGELATGLAHEIKNPLAGLSGALEILAEDLASSPHQAEMVGEMRHQVGRLGHTMESLLSFARPPKARLRTTDVNATLEKVLFLIRQQRKASTIEVQPELGLGLPAVLADPNQLEQVFLNLCLNACQAMNGKGALTVRSFLAEERVTVEITDTGPGIPADLRPHLFKPFFTTKREGNGLGLAISARIVAEHGGNIGYRCPPGGGTVFAITLQQARAGQGPERAVEYSS